MPPPPAVTGRVSRRALPDYLVRTYRWAYLDRRLMPLLDRPAVVAAILWGNARRLMHAAISEFAPGQAVLQAAAVYGDFSPRLSDQLGPGGSLEVVDVAPLQVANVRRKCARHRNVRVRVHDLATALDKQYEGVCCFFLLHEVPSIQRRAIVHNLLSCVAPGGKAVFVDYHRPARWHPLAPLMRWVFHRFEPYAPSLQASEIAELGPADPHFVWQKRLFFGGLYQLVVVRRKEHGISEGA